MPVVDLAFRLTGDKIPADHGYALLAAISRLIPAVHGDTTIGIHPIQGRHVGHRLLALTDRSRLVFRLDSDRIGEILPLAGQQLDLDGHRVRVGVPETRALRPVPHLRSRLVVIKGFIEPEPFLPQFAAPPRPSRDAPSTMHVVVHISGGPSEFATSKSSATLLTSPT